MSCRARGAAATIVPCASSGAYRPTHTSIRSTTLDPSTLTIERIDVESNTLITNLFDLYVHDMAEWFGIEIDEDGRYGYDMAPHWANGDPVYIARCEGRLAGFALLASATPYLVSEDPDALHAREVKEFFVLRRYRRTGLSTSLAGRVWGMHPGRWLVRVFDGNRPALPFWRRTIAEFTNGEVREEPCQANGSAWTYFHFAN